MTIIPVSEDDTYKTVNSRQKRLQGLEETEHSKEPMQKRDGHMEGNHFLLTSREKGGSLTGHLKNGCNQICFLSSSVKILQSLLLYSKRCRLS